MKNCLTPKAENVRPNSTNTIEMRPHDNQSSRENATPYCGAFPLASYKEVPFFPPPPETNKQTTDFLCIEDNLSLKVDEKQSYKAHFPRVS